MRAGGTKIYLLACMEDRKTMGSQNIARAEVAFSGTKHPQAWLMALMICWPVGRSATAILQTQTTTFGGQLLTVGGKQSVVGWVRNG